MVIDQGDIYWLDFDEPTSAGPGYKYPHVVIQNNLLNHSRIRTVIVCAITSNLKRANAPGNVLLERGEGNLSKPGVINVSEIVTVDKLQLGEKIGTLSERRIRQVWAGIRLVLDPTEGILDKDS